MKKVLVLLSTYNGEKYLKEQLDSIISQDYTNLEILIRDDGSTDGTRELLQQYADSDSRITYYRGINLGARDSFFDLIKNADRNADYFAFADQDDIWLKDKLSKAVHQLEQRHEEKTSELPLLYCCNITLVGENLQVINDLQYKPGIDPSFGNALIENICIGCTIVINKALLHFAQVQIPKQAYMHDWWLYLIASCFGNVFFDPQAYVLYRQHNRNTIGAPVNLPDRYLRRIKNSNNKLKIIRNQTAEFETIYQPTGENLILAEHVVEYKTNLKYRFSLVFRNRISRQNKIDNLIFKLMFLFG